jgi:Xaa-Pro aminopeptidase
VQESPVGAGRLTRAADAAAAAGVDALLLSPGADLRYLTGYAAPALERLTCLVLPAAGAPLLVLPRLERPAAEAAGLAEAGVRLVDWAETADPYQLVADHLGAAVGNRPRRIAVGNRMWAEQLLRLRQLAPTAELVLAGELLAPLRMRKSPDEVAALRRAARAIDDVHRSLRGWRWAGRTEEQVARDIREAILDSGHATVNFVIVGSGPNAASPHHSSSDRVIRPGESVVVDIGGAMGDGYCSDSTRTYVVGQPGDEFAASYAVLLEAQRSACAAVRPGVAAGAVDRVAREHITEAGYGPMFIHRTGHGIGLEEHEPPWIVAGNDQLLEPGMCFSVEPGIYVPGRFGARIEDIVAVTDDGVERLNIVDRDLAVVDG